MRIKPKSLLLLLISFSSVAKPPTKITCDVTIVGGGIAGLHTAYQLSKSKAQPGLKHICLFEKEARLGGRVYDVPHDKGHPELVYGLGALRVMEGQNQVFALAKELGIELEREPYRDDLINARGQFVFSSDELNRIAYPDVSDSLMDHSGFGTEQGFYNLLLKHRDNAKTFFDIRSFFRHVLGAQGYQFLTDAIRFRGEFLHPADARAFFDYLIEDQKQCCAPSYPKGGMSQFAIKMTNIAAKNGVRIFTSEPVLSINRNPGTYPYGVVTKNFIAKSKRLVIAADPNGLNKIAGEVANGIKQQPQFKDIFGIPVVVINQQWPRDWWSKSGYDGKDIHRAWTTEHCLNFIEIPINNYAASQLVTRSVYCDEPSCNAHWENILEKGGIKAVEAEIMGGLKHLFPKADIPAPKVTIVKMWPAGWYWLKGGTRFTIDDMIKWAEQPMAKEPIALVGEAYFIKRSGWIDGAISSSKNALKRHFAGP